MTGQAQFDFFVPGEKKGTGTWWRTSKKTKTPRPGSTIEATFVKDVGTGRSTDEKPIEFFEYQKVLEYVKRKAALVAEVHGTHQLDPKAVRTMSLTTAGKKALDDTGVPYTSATKSGLNQAHKEHTDAVAFLEEAVTHQKKKAAEAAASPPKQKKGQKTPTSSKKKQPTPKRMVEPTAEEAMAAADAAQIEEMTGGAVTAEEVLAADSGVREEFLESLNADARDREEGEFQQAIRESALVAQPQQPRAPREGKKTSASDPGGAPSRPPPPPPRQQQPRQQPPPASESKDEDDEDEPPGPIARAAAARLQSAMQARSPPDPAFAAQMRKERQEAAAAESARKQKAPKGPKGSAFVEDVPSPEGAPESDQRQRMGKPDGDAYEGQNDQPPPKTPQQRRRQARMPTPESGSFEERQSEGIEGAMMGVEGARSAKVRQSATGKNPDAAEYVPSPQVRMRVQRQGTARATPNTRQRRGNAEPSIGKGVGRLRGIGGTLGTDSDSDSGGGSSGNSTTTSDAGIDPVMAAALSGGAGEKEAGTQTDKPEEETGTALYSGNTEAPERESGHTPSQADMAKTAEGAVYPEAVKRIAKKRRQDYRAWRNSFIKQHAGSINKMDDAALLWGCQELMEQYMPTMHIRTLRYRRGATRRDLVRQYVELSVLSKLSEDDGEGSEKLAMLLANNKLGLSLADLVGEGRAIKSGSASTDPYAPLKADGTKEKNAAPVGSAVDYQQETLPIIPPEKEKKERHSQGTVDTKQSVDERGEVGRVLPVEYGSYDVRLVDNNMSSTASLPTLKQHFDLRLNKQTEPKRFKLIL